MEKVEKQKWSNLKIDNLSIHIVIACLLIMLQSAVINQAIQCHEIVCAIINIVALIIWIIFIIIHCEYNYNRHVARFLLLHEDSILPKKRDGDAGYDIYARFDKRYIFISPNETKLIPTGLASIFDEKYVAILKERGSTGTRGIGQRAGVIDSNYRGEWFVPVTNHNNVPLVICKRDYYEDFADEDVILYPYNKAICQAIFIQNPRLDIKGIDYGTYLDKAKESNRGTGALGSTGK